MVSHSIGIDIDLVFDIRGLQLCLARRYECLEQIQIGLLYHKPVYEGFRELGVDVSEDQLLNYFKTVRPHLHVYSLLKQYDSVVLLTSIEDNLTSLLLENNPLISQLISKTVSITDIDEIARSVPRVIVNSLSLDTTLKERGLESIHVKFPRGEESEVDSIAKLANHIEPDPSLWKNFLSLEEPVALQGKIVKGFNRGSSELGFPTANLDITEQVSSGLVPGIYAAEAHFEDDPKKYKAAVSIGWCPQYNNTNKTIEAYIIHSFEGNLYGRILCVKIFAFIRGECAFSSLEDLISAIGSDVRITEEIISL